ncbi:MAG TPA: DUF1669 domain-containing protein [Candidatus Bathyarchaeota archaeon]|nr:DUF1669 domain-containing protein [Candidatus Bathyarchaeota archaeon]
MAHNLQNQIFLKLFLFSLLIFVAGTITGSFLIPHIKFVYITTTKAATVTSSETLYTTFYETFCSTNYAITTETSSITFTITYLSSYTITEKSTLTVVTTQAGNCIQGVYFSPKGGCASQVIYWIQRARFWIHIMIYSFTLDEISDALIDAHNRGVEVLVLFESSQINQYSEYEKLKEAGVQVKLDSNPFSMHHKVMIVDGYIVLTGSFNWSNSAENRNNENLVVIVSRSVASRYEEEFQKLWGSGNAQSKEGGENEQTKLKVVISYVHYDAAGNDHYNLNDEYVVIWNRGTSPVDMTGWRLKDRAGHTFTFPSFVLGPNKKVAIYTGSGTNTSTKLYWGRNRAVWNNNGDTAYLYDSNWNLIDVYSW